MIRNGGLAVATAAIIRWNGEGIGLVVALWLAVAAIMTYVGVQMLSLLRPED